MLGVTHPHTRAHIHAQTHTHGSTYPSISWTDAQLQPFFRSASWFPPFLSLLSLVLLSPSSGCFCLSYMHSLSMHSQIHSDSVIFPAGRITFEAEDRGIKARSSHSDGIQSVTSKHWNTPGLGECCTNHSRLSRFVTADTNALMVCFKVFFIIQRNLLEIIKQNGGNWDYKAQTVLRGAYQEFKNVVFH